MVAGAKQLEALAAVIRRVTDVGEAAGLKMVHQAAAAGGGGGGDGELPPLDAAAHPEAALGGAGGAAGPGALAAAGLGSAWKPKNTIVRGVIRDLGAREAAAAAAAAAARDGERQESARRGGRFA
jgi:hypothetical protein